MIFDLLGGVIRSSVANDRPLSVLWRKPMRFIVVQQVDRRAAAEDLVAVGDDAGQVAGAQRHVVERHARRAACR